MQDKEIETAHPIKVAAARTGLSPHVIRAWERRYGAIAPRRTRTNRRLYTNAEIDRLLLLRRATEAGRGIGHVAGLSAERLRRLLEEDRAADEARRSRPGVHVEQRAYLARALAAVERLDGDELEETMLEASANLSIAALVDELALPLMVEVGERWRRGTLRAAHEHAASAVVRTLLGNLISAHHAPENAPEIIVATPAGQVHEYGALGAAVGAAAAGWRVTYLGPDLPAAEIAGAARQKGARAVALSLVYPTDDGRLPGELARLRRLLPDDVTILVGGGGVPAYEDALRRIGARQVPGGLALHEALEALRARPSLS